MKKRNLVVLCDETLDYLASIFINNEVLDKKGISFITFVDMWKKGKLEEVLN